MQQELEQVKEQAIERKTVNNDYFFEISDRISLLNIDVDMDMDNVQQLKQLSVNMGNFADYLMEQPLDLNVSYADVIVPLLYSSLNAQFFMQLKINTLLQL